MNKPMDLNPLSKFWKKLSLNALLCALLNEFMKVVELELWFRLWNLWKGFSQTYLYEDETLEQGFWAFGFGDSYVCKQPSYIMIFFVLMISSQLGLRKTRRGFYSLTHILNSHCCYVDAQLVFWNIMVALCYNTWQLCTPTNPNFHYIVNVRHTWLIFCYVNVLVLHQWYLLCSFFSFPFAWIWNLNM
jgi:hypothetical protein